MSKKNNIFYPPLFSGEGYFSKGEFKFPITTKEKTVNKSTFLKNNKGITLLFFKNNNGKIIVNSTEISVKRGTFICLANYHYFKIVPDINKSIDFIECRLSYDTFLYIAANPYYLFSEITLSSIPLTSHLEGHLLDGTEILFERLVKSTAKNNNKFNEIDFLLCMKLIGILQYTNNKNIFK